MWLFTVLSWYYKIIMHPGFSLPHSAVVSRTLVAPRVGPWVPHLFEHEDVLVKRGGEMWLWQDCHNTPVDHVPWPINYFALNLFQVISHPYYNSRNFNNDITLLKLSSPVQFNTRVAPVCLASSSTSIPSGTKCVTTGWGRTGSTCEWNSR